MQIQYFERLNPEMECIYLLERRYQAGEDAPHSIPALRDYLSVVCRDVILQRNSTALASGEIQYPNV